MIMSNQLNLTARFLTPKYLQDMGLEENTTITVIPVKEGKRSNSVPKYNGFFLALINNTLQDMTVTSIKYGNKQDVLEGTIKLMSKSVISYPIEPKLEQTVGKEIFFVAMESKRALEKKELALEIKVPVTIQ